jgi:S-adenosylmethionine:tRNA ribosyltransferase-isomerase
MTLYKTADYFFTVPEDQVALVPSPQRQDAKLLCYVPQTRDAYGNEAFSRELLGISHHSFAALPRLLKQIFPQGCLLVQNHTKVIPARLLCTVDNILLDGLLVEYDRQAETPVFQGKVLVKPFKKIKKLWSKNPNLLAYIQGKEGIFCKILDASSNPILIETPLPLLTFFEQYGYTPLPPYINQDILTAETENFHKDRYQTVYATDPGSVAAPTAGFHFTPQILQECLENNISVVPVYLHIGMGTFKPIQTEYITDHVMHEEYYKVPASTFSVLETAKQNKIPIVLVGTTSLRSLESFYKHHTEPAKYTDQWLATKLFITPPNYVPQVGQAIITNFHFPNSTLVVLIHALLGPVWRDIYTEALAKQYRFYSYGDSSLLVFPCV